VKVKKQKKTLSKKNYIAFYTKKTKFNIQLLVSVYLCKKNLQTLSHFQKVKYL